MTTTPEPPTLTERVATLTDTVAGLDERVAAENELRSKRIKSAEDAIDGQRTTTQWALVAAVVGIGVGLIALVSVFGVVKVERDFHSSTRTARIGSCMQQQKAVPKTIAASDAGWATFAAVTWPPATRTPALERMIEAGLIAEHATAVKTNPLRDCTPTGIADFLSGRGGYETTTTPPVATTSTVP